MVRRRVPDQLARPHACLTAALSTELAELAEAASSCLDAGKADATRKAYARDAAAFSTWCASNGLDAMPVAPTTVGLYLAHLAEEGRKVSTIERALAAIGAEQRAAGHGWSKGHPAISGVMKGIRRTLGVPPVRARAGADRPSTPRSRSLRTVRCAARAGSTGSRRGRPSCTTC